MEKAFQQYAHNYIDIGFHLVRYGNVIGSNASVVKVWRQMIEEHGKVWATDADMTRFWITVDDAVDFILLSMECESGNIWIGNMKALSMAQMANYTIPEDIEIEFTGIRPGEN
jgi:UDP-N-acetylglucosamine 4,6-dehydratase